MMRQPRLKLSRQIWHSLCISWRPAVVCTQRKSSCQLASMQLHDAAAATEVFQADMALFLCLLAPRWRLHTAQSSCQQASMAAPCCPKQGSCIMRRPSLKCSRQLWRSFCASWRPAVVCTQHTAAVRMPAQCQQREFYTNSSKSVAAEEVIGTIQGRNPRSCRAHMAGKNSDIPLHACAPRLRNLVLDTM